MAITQCITKVYEKLIILSHMNFGIPKIFEGNMKMKL